jgi:hypothetical protein
MITFPNAIFAAMRYKVGRFFQSTSLADTASVADSAPVLLIGKRPSEVVTLADTLTLSGSVVHTEVVSVADAISLLFSGGVIVSDTVTVGSSGILLIQDYCDFSYFAADYVGTSSTF